MAFRQEGETLVSGLFLEVGLWHQMETCRAETSSKTHRGWQGLIP